MISIYVQKGCKASVHLLEKINEIEKYIKLNIYVKGNNDFPSFITKTPTIIYNNFPYQGKSAFKLIKTIKIKIEQKITKEASPLPVVKEEPEIELLSANDKSMYSEALLTKDGFEDNFIDYNLDSNNDTKELNVEEYIKKRNEIVEDIINPDNK